MIKLAYTFNILVLIPVCWSLFFGNNKKGLIVFNHLYREEKGLSFLLGSLWFGILVCSIAGLYYPYKFWPILLFQIIYKFTYLVTFLIPSFLHGAKFPKGIAIFFVIIIITYPFILYNAGLLW